MFLFDIWNHLVSFSGATVLIGLLVSCVIFLVEQFIYRNKKHQ